MILPVQITFRNMKPSDKVRGWIDEEAAKLDKFYDRITGCHVVVEVPNRRLVSGTRYHVRIDLTVPGAELVVSRRPNGFRSMRQMGEPKITKVGEAAPHHRELRQAINDAFKEMGRILQDHARVARGDMKVHPPDARPAKKSVQELGNRDCRKKAGRLLGRMRKGAHRPEGFGACS